MRVGLRHANGGWAGDRGPAGGTANGLGSVRRRPLGRLDLSDPGRGRLRQRGRLSDDDYAAAGAEIVRSGEPYGRAQVVACVNAVGRLARLRNGQIVIGTLQPGRHRALMEHWLRRGVIMISLDRAVRAAGAPGIDPTLTQARITGRQAVLLAERHFGGSFPMMAPDGQVRPVSLLVLGAGMVGLQGMSTARLLGADVTGYSGRPGGPAAIAARGAHFLRLGASLISQDGVRRVRRELGDQERVARRHALDIRVGQFDVVITAAGAPSDRPPRLVSVEAIERMRPGLVIIDVAAGQYGGNVAGSRPGRTITVPPGVRLIGATNLPSQAPGLASEYYSDNMVAALCRLCSTGEPLVELGDPLWSGMVLGHEDRPVRPDPVVSVPLQRPTPERSPRCTPVSLPAPAK